MANLQPRFHFKKLSDKPEAGTIACFINNSGDLPDFIKKIDKSGVLPHVIAEHNLTNSRNSAVVPLQDDKDFYHLILIGLGEKILNSESYRRMIGQIIRAAEKHKS